MKNLFLLVALLFATSLSAQVPFLINYQGLALDGTGQPLGATTISLRLSILETSVLGNAVYIENHQATTSANGIFNILIGGGMPTLGTMQGINWGVHTKFLKVEMDAAGGSNYSLVGVSQLVSSPYALYAEYANHVNPDNLPGNSTFNYEIVSDNGPDSISIEPVTGESVTIQFKIDSLSGSEPIQAVISEGTVIGADIGDYTFTNPQGTGDMQVLQVGETSSFSINITNGSNDYDGIWGIKIECTSQFTQLKKTLYIQLKIVDNSSTLIDIGSYYAYDVVGYTALCKNDNGITGFTQKVGGYSQLSNTSIQISLVPYGNYFRPDSLTTAPYGLSAFVFDFAQPTVGDYSDIPINIPLQNIELIRLGDFVSLNAPNPGVGTISGTGYITPNLGNSWNLITVVFDDLTVEIDGEVCTDLKASFTSDH